MTVTGEQVAASQELGDFTPVAGQRLSYLIPAGMSMQDIRYTVELPETVSRQTTRITADVTATLDELTLPQLQLQLERPPQPRVDFSLAQLLSPSAAIESVPHALRLPLAIVCLTLIVLIFIWLHRQIKCHARRRHLKNKIRRMKKKMQP